MSNIEDLLLSVKYHRETGEDFECPDLETIAKCYKELERFEELEKECEMLKRSDEEKMKEAIDRFYKMHDKSMERLCGKSK